MSLKVIHPMKKVRQRAEQFARSKCELTKTDDGMYFAFCVDAFIAGYMSGIRETKRKENKK